MLRAPRMMAEQVDGRIPSAPKEPVVRRPAALLICDPRGPQLRCELLDVTGWVPSRSVESTRRLIQRYVER